MFNLEDVSNILDSAFDTGISIEETLSKLSNSVLDNSSQTDNDSLFDNTFTSTGSVANTSQMQYMNNKNIHNKKGKSFCLPRKNVHRPATFVLQSSSVKTDAQLHDIPIIGALRRDEFQVGFQQFSGWKGLWKEDNLTLQSVIDAKVNQILNSFAKLNVIVDEELTRKVVEEHIRSSQEQDFSKMNENTNCQAINLPTHYKNTYSICANTSTVESPEKYLQNKTFSENNYMKNSVLRKDSSSSLPNIFTSFDNFYSRHDLSQSCPNLCQPMIGLQKIEKLVRNPRSSWIEGGDIVNQNSRSGESIDLIYCPGSLGNSTFSLASEQSCRTYTLSPDLQNYLQFDDRASDVLSENSFKVSEVSDFNLSEAVHAIRSISNPYDMWPTASDERPQLDSIVGPFAMNSQPNKTSPDEVHCNELFQLQNKEFYSERNHSGTYEQNSNEINIQLRARESEASKSRTYTKRGRPSTYILDKPQLVNLEPVNKEPVTRHSTSPNVVKQTSPRKSEPLSARLAALRMQLEEKRRQFEEKKKQKQREISRERSRVLKDAFFVVSSTGKENTNLLANNNTSQSNMWEIRFDEEFQVPELPKPNQPQSEIELLKPKVPTRQYSLQSSKEVLSPVTLSDDARPQIEEQEEKGIEKNEVESIPMEESHYLSTRIDEPLQKSLHEEREMVPAVHVSETEELKKNTEAKTMNGFHFTTPSQLEYNLSGNHRNSYHAHNSFENTQVLFETPQMSPDGFDVQPACDLGSQLHFESMPVNEEVPYEPPIEKNTAQVLPQIMVNKSSPNKSCAFTFNDIGDSSQEMTPDQKRKKERFIRMRIKKQQEEKANKETALEKKRIESEKLVAEKQAKEEDRKRLEQECANAYLLREASQLQHRLYNKHLHEITYNVNPVQRKELPTSGQSHQKAIVGQTNQVESRPDPPLRQLVQGSQEESTHNFSEYNGPGSYQKPSGKSNRKIVQNAIMHACLCGEVNKEAKNKCLAALAQSNANHFLVLFREGLKFRSVYSYNPDSGAVARIYGVGPKTITPKMMLKFYKYNSGAKEFYSLETKHLSIQVDGFMIKKELWEKKPGLSKINSASKHREPILTMDRR